MCQGPAKPGPFFCRCEAAFWAYEPFATGAHHGHHTSALLSTTRRVHSGHKRRHCRAGDHSLPWLLCGAVAPGPLVRLEIGMDFEPLAVVRVDLVEPVEALRNDDRIIVRADERSVAFECGKLLLFEPDGKCDLLRRRWRQLNNGHCVLSWFVQLKASSSRKYVIVSPSGLIGINGLGTFWRNSKTKLAVHRVFLRTE